MFLFMPATHIRVSVRWPALSRLTGSQNRFGDLDKDAMRMGYSEFYSRLPDPFLKCLCNLRPTFEAIKTRRRSSRPIFQPKRQKATPTSVKQAMLSTPCTICPPSPQKNAPSLKANPMIAQRMMVAPIKQKSIAHEVFQKTYHLLAIP